MKVRVERAGELELAPIVLAPGATIEGRVIGPDGRAVASATVFAYRVEPFDERGGRTVYGNADGVYRVGGLAAGRYSVVAFRNPGFTGRLLTASSPPPSTTVEVRPGATVSFDVTLDRAAARASGRRLRNRYCPGAYPLLQSAAAHRRRRPTTPRSPP